MYMSYKRMFNWPSTDFMHWKANNRSSEMARGINQGPCSAKLDCSILV